MISTTIALTACGVSTQDQGVGDGAAKPVTGLAIDGYIARAVVYADVDENNKLDVWEKRALTDSEGYFTYNPNSEINYCSLPETDSKSIHCLHAPPGYDEVVIRITQGYDLTTVEPFTGTLSMRVNVSSATIETAFIGSPINSLLAEMTVEEQQTFLDLETSLKDELLDNDYLNFDTGNGFEGANAERKAIVSLAINLHKVADIFSALLDKEFAASNGDSDGFFGVEVGIPVDATVYVYRAFADVLLNRDSSSSPIALSTVLGDSTKLESVVQRAFELISEAISNYNIRQSDSSDHHQVPTGIVANSIATSVTDFMALSDTLFQDNLDSADLEGDVMARLRALSIVASLVRDDESVAAQSAIAAATDASLTTTNNKTYMQNLRSAAVDVGLLKQKFIDGTFIIDDSDFNERQGFADLLGSSDSNGITGDNTEGFSGNQLAIGSEEDGVKVDFHNSDSDDATSGTMTIDPSFVDGDLEGVDTLEGTWEQLDEYTMLMNVEVAGVIEPVIIKPTLDADGNTVYNFDLGGEQKTWIPE